MTGLDFSGVLWVLCGLRFDFCLAVFRLAGGVYVLDGLVWFVLFCWLEMGSHLALVFCVVLGFVGWVLGCFGFVGSCLGGSWVVPGCLGSLWFGVM